MSGLMDREQTLAEGNNCTVSVDQEGTLAEGNCCMAASMD